MTDYTKLVKALRWCANDEICTEEVNCGYWNKEPFCTVSLMTDAAAAIEELQAEVDALKHDIERYVQMNTELLNDRPELEEIGGKWVWKEPKRGEEVWKDVIGYEGLYQVSNQARVRNNKGKILKQSVKVGKCVYYKYVKLYKDGQYRQGYVHRMMAECFIPNPDNLPIINHKDEDGTNNRLDNLEWCTVEYNSNYGNAKRNMSKGKRRRAKMEVQE